MFPNKAELNKVKTNVMYKNIRIPHHLLKRLFPLVPKKEKERPTETTRLTEVE